MSLPRFLSLSFFLFLHFLAHFSFLSQLIIRYLWSFFLCFSFHPRLVSFARTELMLKWTLRLSLDILSSCCILSAFSIHYQSVICVCKGSKKAERKKRAFRDAQTSSGVKVLEATERRSTHRNNVQHVRRRREGKKKKSNANAKPGLW